MKNNILYLLVALAIGFAGCSKFDELEADPNRSTTVPPGLVLRGLLRDVYNAPWGDEHRWNQYWCSNYNYYDDNEYSWTSASLKYTNLKNVAKMEEEAIRVGLDANNSFSGLGKFFRAYFYYDMTMKVGEFPLTEALQGSDNVAPKYDSQKAVFVQIGKWLEESNDILAKAITKGDQNLKGFDFYFDGDLKKWQKVVNAFRIRTLIQLSKHEGDADLKVKTEFAKILADPAKYPLPGANSDNMSFVYTSIEKYPFNPDNFGFYADRYNTSATYVNTLSALKDPRVFIVAEPAKTKLAAGLLPTDPAAYVGAPSDEGLDAMATKVQAGDYSRISKTRFFSTYQGELCVQIGYPELCLNIAEGINRGWASGDAADYYSKGILASMNSYGITDATVFSTYINQTTTKYKGNNADGLAQILTQRYLALAQHSGLEAYYNWRRTKTPTFSEGGPGTGNSGKIPLRFQYPVNERNNNNKNYTESIQRQFGNTTDSKDDAIWIIK